MLFLVAIFHGVTWENACETRAHTADADNGAENLLTLAALCGRQQLKVQTFSVHLEFLNWLNTD